MALQKGHGLGLCKASMLGVNIGNVLTNKGSLPIYRALGLELELLITSSTAQLYNDSNQTIHVTQIIF